MIALLGVVILGSLSPIHYSPESNVIQMNSAEAAPSCPSGGTLILPGAKNANGVFDGAHADAAYACRYADLAGTGFDYYNEDGTRRKDTLNVVPTGDIVQTDTNGKMVPKPTSCDVGWNLASISAVLNPICWGRFLGSLVGGLLVYI